MKERTTAEVVLDFYRVVRETASDLVVLGCNTIGHLVSCQAVPLPEGRSAFRFVTSLYALCPMSPRAGSSGERSFSTGALRDQGPATVLAVTVGTHV